MRCADSEWEMGDLTPDFFTTRLTVELDCCKVGDPCFPRDPMLSSGLGDVPVRDIVPRAFFFGLCLSSTCSKFG